MWPVALLSGYIELHAFLPGFGNIGCKNHCRFKPEVPGARANVSALG